VEVFDLIQQHFHFTGAVDAETHDRVGCAEAALDDVPR
jgi:hypothetical protein